MRKQSLNTKGFAPLGLLIAVAAVLVVGGSGVYVYHKNHKAKTPVVAKSTSSTKSSTQTSKISTTTATPNPYAGWKTYTAGSTGLTFKYPGSWTVSETPICGGADGYSVKAPTSEFAGIAISPVGEALTSYSLGVTVNPTPATAQCGPSLSSLEGALVGSQSQSRTIKSGALAGKYVLVNGTVADGTTGLDVLDNSYSVGQKIGETGSLTVGGASLQVGAGFAAGQDIGDATTSGFVNSQLYTDTVNILNSFSISN